MQIAWCSLQDILDDEEQEGVIAALEGQALAQVSRAKFWVGTGGVLFTSMYIMFSIIQIIEPWTLLHHTPFRLILPLTLTVVAEMLAGGAIALATLSLVKFQFRDAMPDRSRNLLLKSSIYLAVVVFAFWVTSIVRLAISNPDQVKGLRFWRIFWKPLLPGLSVLGVVWTINGLNSIRRELSQLRSAKYTLKQA